MRYPDSVEILHLDVSTPDAYGNPSWSAPVPAKAFVTHEAAMLPPLTDIRTGDRLVVPGRGTFAIEGAPKAIRSPSRHIMWRVKLAPLPEGV